MSSKKALTTKVHVDGHYDVSKSPWASDYVWVPGGEEVELALLEEVLHPWRAAYAEWEKEVRKHPEEQARMEMGAL